MPRHPEYSPPRKCWVGDKQKVIYDDLDTAELAAPLVAQEQGLPKGSLHAYKCEYGDHYHLASDKNHR